MLNLKNYDPLNHVFMILKYILFLFYYIYLIRPSYDIRYTRGKLSKFTHARIRSGKTGQPGCLHALY